MGDIIFSRRGMTLMEITITAVIMAILVGLAIPSYRNSVEQARANEGTTNLSIIRAAQKLYKLDNNAYKVSGTCTATGANPSACGNTNGNLNGDLNIDISAQFYTLTASAPTPGSLATAKRFGGTKLYWIDEDGVISSSGSF